VVRPRVLYVCHNHPAVRPGGAEAYALELYHGILEQGEFEPVFLAKGGPPLSLEASRHSETLLGLVNGDPNQYLLYTDGYQYDSLYGTITGKDFYVRHFHNLLIAFRPDIVHFQHTAFLGYDMIRQVRNTLPAVPILYTLHEYLPICHRHGQMLRTVNREELCETESPRRCHECFPDIAPQTFFLRKRFIQSQLSLVDLFLAPSRFLRQKFIEWGIPEEKIRFEEYGRLPVTPLPDNHDEGRLRCRFGYFGQFNPYKGLDVLLKAMKLLSEGAGENSARNGKRDGDLAASVPRLWVHGANLDLQAGTFQNEIRSLLEATRQDVTLVGQYEHDLLPRLMHDIDWVVVPSIWWENSPLVIQEAFSYGKPILCSDIGGMAEKVTHGVNGLHFRARDVAHLAQTIREAASTPELWDQLRRGIPPVYPMKEHVQTITGLYRQAIELKTADRQVP